MAFPAYLAIPGGCQLQLVVFAWVLHFPKKNNLAEIHQGDYSVDWTVPCLHGNLVCLQVD